MLSFHPCKECMDLVKFYVEKGDLEKALETAEKGILEGEGWITELLEFL